MDAKTVIREYFQHLSKIERTQFKPPKFPSSRILEQAAEFLRWCEAKNIQEPELYIRFRLDGGRARRFRIPFKALKSEAVAEAWHKWGATKYRVGEWTQKQHAAIRPAEVDRIKSLRYLAPATESYQYFHVAEGRVELCMATPQYSGGFHPMSRVCPSCPKSIACADKLNQAHGFNVVDLRHGRIERLPREIQAAAIA